MAIDLNEVFDLIRRIKGGDGARVGLGNSRKEGGLVLHVYVETSLYSVLEEPNVGEVVVDGNAEGGVVGEIGYHEEDDVGVEEIGTIDTQVGNVALEPLADGAQRGVLQIFIESERKSSPSCGRAARPRIWFYSLGLLTENTELFWMASK